MPYTPQTWTNGSGGGTPISAARLTIIEAGIQAAQAAAEAAIAKALADAKGDLLVATASDTIARLPIGADDTVPTAAPAQATGIAWQKVGNAMIAAGAAIDYSKLNLAGAIVNGDIGAAAAISGSKLGTGIDLSKLTGYPTDATKFARGDGTWATAGETLIERTEITADVSLSGGGGYVDVIAGTARTYAAVATTFEFYCVNVIPSGVGIYPNIALYDGATAVAIIWTVAGGGYSGAGVRGLIRFSPSAGSHTYNIKGNASDGSGTVKAGTGTGGANAPAFMRISTGV